MARSRLNGLSRNRLLASLSQSDVALLAPHMDAVSFQRRKQLEFPDRKIDAVYFVEQGLASVVTRIEDHENEVGIIGNEGVTGVPILLGADRTPCATYIQISGHGQQVPAEVIRQAMRQSESLRRTLLLFAQTFLLQIAHNVTAAARGTLEQRLARWVLMAHDRVDGDEVPLTHEFLALMMGTRRPGVTHAVHTLADKRLVHGDRGRIIVLDRDGLEKFAGKLYGTPEREYQRLLG